MTKTLWAHLSFTYVGSVPSSSLNDLAYFNGYAVGYKYVQTVHGYAQTSIDYVTEASHYGDTTRQLVDGNNIYVWQGFGVPDSFVLTDPDLSVQLKSVTPTTLAPNGQITLAFDIKNNGTQTAGASNFGIYLSNDAIIDKSDTLLGSFQQGVLGGKSTSQWYNVTSPPLTIPGGTHYIGIIVDKDGAVSESNEGNNVSNAIKITSKGPTDADLKVSLKSATPSTVAKDGSLHIDYTLTNAGDAAAIAPATVFYLSKDATIDKNDLFLGSLTVDMAGNSALTYSDDWGLYDVFPAGKYYLGAIIDRDGIIKESNEGNNVSNAIPITITGPNANPIGWDDSATTTYRKPVKIDILANDSDPNPDDKLDFVIVRQPHDGTVVVNPDKTVTFTPDPGFFGQQSFTYDLFDNHGSHSPWGNIIVDIDVGYEDTSKYMGVLKAQAKPYSWGFEIPEGAQGTYTFEFDIAKPVTLHGLITGDAPVTAGLQFHPTLIASLGNKAPTLGPGPDRNGRRDTSHLNEDGTAQVIDDPLMPGRYALEILRQPNDDGPYGGRVQLFLAPDEAGNRIEWATPIRTGAMVKGAVDVIDNKDVYKFTLKEQSSVLVSLAVDGKAIGIDGVPPLHYEIMTNAQALDYYHVLESHKDAASRYVDSAYTAPDLTDPNNNPLDAGDYYIIIYHPENIKQPPQDLQTFNYSLWVNTWADHAANRPLTTDFGPEGPKSASIGDITNTTYKNRDFLGLADANDYYMFSLSERQTVSIALTQPSKDVSMDVELSNMLGGGSTNILVDAVETGGGARSIVATLDAGIYFVKASTDTDFTDPNGTSKYGTPLVLPKKGGGTYDLTIKSAAPVSAPGILLGTAGTDNFKGGSGADRFNGKGGNDKVQGMGGDDTLLGDIGTDIMDGGDGDDMLTGGMGADLLTGGAGSDTFMYLKSSEGGDTITDFTPGQDKIGIVKSAFGLTKVAKNAADPNFDFALHYFVSGAGAAATEKHGQFVFDTSSSSLYWDANGDAAGGTVLLAKLGNGATLTANDIDINF